MKTIFLVRRKKWLPLVDLLVLSIALWLAYMLRFDWDLPAREAKRMLVIWPYTVLLQYLILWLHDVPRFVWRYVSLREMRIIFRSLGIATIFLLLLRSVIPLITPTLPPINYLFVSYGVIMMDSFAAFLGVVGVRVLVRLNSERKDSAKHAHGRAGANKPTLLIGAGQAGVMIAREILNRPDLGMEVVGFLDDDPEKLDTKIMGFPVLGNSNQIATVCQKYEVSQVLVSIASASGSDLRRITRECKEVGIKAKVIPGLFKLVGGELNLARIRDVAIEDLLRRPAVTLEKDKIAAILKDRVIVVSGAGGSIGSEMCRQICDFGPQRLILLERSENNLFSIHKELLESHPGLAFVPYLADITDRPRIERLMREQKPSIIFHAAAHKHVPMLEWNPCEAITNNIHGTRTLADAAHAAGVESFVMISTDKAVNPTSVMGTSKRIAEIYIQALSQRSKTRFITVRFGNVLGSVGSVVPIFKQQIEKGGPVTITHPDMKRYFMTIPEASQLVLQAGTMGSGGEIYVLDMGEPVKIVDLARDLITLSGFTPDVDIEIKFTGVRPGEKLFEELAIDGENVDKTKHEKILVMKFKPYEWERICGQITDLLAMADNADLSAIKRAFKSVVPEFQSPDGSAAKVAAVPPKGTVATV